MSEVTQLRAEVVELRNIIESYKQRDLEYFQTQLSAALSNVEHYRQEAYKNAETGRQIHAEAQETIQLLRAQLDGARRMNYGNPREIVEVRGAGGQSSQSGQPAGARG